MTDFPNIFSNLQQLAPEFAEHFCIINGAIMQLDEIQNMGYEEFSLRSKVHMPSKFYRYFPNTVKDGKPNYSIQALENNTVYLNSPDTFDDVYDSDIHIDYPEYEHLRLIEYCRRCGLNVDEKQSTEELGNALVKVFHECFLAHQNLDGVFSQEPTSEREKFSNEWFVLKVLNVVYQGKDFGVAVGTALQEEYRDFTSDLK